MSNGQPQWHTRTETTPVPILLYHAVTATPPSWIAPFSVTPTEFARQLDAIVERGCVPLTVSGLVDRRRAGVPLPASPVVITFDDGFADTADVAAPALIGRALTATVYITTGALRGSRPPQSLLPPAPMLAWEQLVDLETQGIEVGAHTHRHSQLDVAPPLVAVEDVRRSKGLLEDALGHPVRSFAYPHGFSNRAVRQLVGHAGHDSACAVSNALSGSDDHELALSRLTVRATTTVAQLNGWLAGQGARVAPFPERWRTRAWRRYRWASALRLR